MSKKTFSISQSLSQGWKLTKANLGFLIGVLLIAWILPSLLQKILDNSLGGLVSFVASEIISIGLIVISLKIIRGKKPKFRDLYANYSLFFNYLIASILLGLIVVFGLLLLVVPGIYLALKYQFTLYLVVDKKMGVLAAMEKSAKMTKGKIMDLFAFMVVLILVNLLGALALGFGMLISLPVTMLAVAHVYKKLS